MRGFNVCFSTEMLPPISVFLHWTIACVTQPVDSSVDSKCIYDFCRIVFFQKVISNMNLILKSLFRVTKICFSEMTVLLHVFEIFLSYWRSSGVCIWTNVFSERNAGISGIFPGKNNSHNCSEIIQIFTRMSVKTWLLKLTYWITEIMKF